MYSPESLKQKNLKELKEIGWQLNVLPDGDRRCRQNWIDALVGVQPPLLQLLEVSPAAEVELVAEAIEVQAQEPLLESPPRACECPICGAVHALYSTKDYLDRPEIRCLHCDYSRFKNYPGAIQLEVQEPPIESNFGRIVHPKSAVKLIEPATETSPGVENFTEADRPPNRGDNGRDRLEVEPKLSQSAIVPATENLLDVEPDPNPILPGIKLSDRFLARYCPPRSEIIHFQADNDGQLSLIDFTVETSDEPPDPDDYHSIFAFWAAYDAWVEADEDEDKPIEISLDSMCEWAPCPAAWYEPAAKSSSTCNFSIPTFDTWCDRAAHQNDSDEPPDTGIFARLPGPKPPNFPPRAIGSDTAKKSLNANRHTTRSPIAAQAHITHIAAGSSSQSGRSPPGGDAMH
ncbi:MULTISPECIES: hypothetical protein [unclassified Microcoleus]|uniref:hypothetical protein n=1 Tax=unclassified Microcoleus TaxID=2642155 RepID=UPI002FD197B7